MYLNVLLVADNLSQSVFGVLNLTKHLIFVHPHMPISESWCLSQALYEQDWGKGCFFFPYHGYLVQALQRKFHVSQAKN